MSSPRRIPSRVVAVSIAVLAVIATTVPPAHALNDPLYDRQWGLQKIGAKAAWDAGLLGEGVDIAIVDTGVHLKHQDLAANIVAGRNFVTAGASPQDDESHGTHVAGIAAATIDNGGSVGVAPKARIMPVKVLNSEGRGNTSSVANGIVWAADNGAEVVNLSLGDDLQKLLGPVEPIIEAVRYAWGKGVVCVFSAGNDYLFPSGFGNEPALVVSATDSDDDKSDFSNGVGNAGWGIAAPGGDDSTDLTGTGIWSTVWTSDAKTNEYAEKSGTSMAAPFVSGAIAVLRAAGLNHEQAVQRLLQTAKDLGSGGRDSTYGYGRLDVARAVEGLRAGGGTTGGGGTSGGTTGGTTASTPTATGGATATGGSGSATTSRPGVRPRSTPQPTIVPAPGASVAPPGTEPAAPADGEVLELEADVGDGETGSGDGGDDRDVPPAAAVIAGVLALAAGSGVGVMASALRRRADT